MHAVRRPGRVPLRRRLPPPHRAQHLGVEGRLAAAAGDDRALPRRDPLSRPADARRRAQARRSTRVSARRRVRPRRQRGDLPPRPGRQRHRALPRPPARGVAGRHGHGAARPARAARRSRLGKPRLARALYLSSRWRRRSSASTRSSSASPGDSGDGMQLTGARVHERDGRARQRPLDAARLPGRDPRARRLAARASPASRSTSPTTTSSRPATGRTCSSR